MYVIATRVYLDFNAEIMTIELLSLTNEPLDKIFQRT